MAWNEATCYRPFTELLKKGDGILRLVTGARLLPVCLVFYLSLEDVFF
jgi:hypothetical protein